MRETNQHAAANEVIETDFFNKTMPRDRALQIMPYLHFVDNNNVDPDDRLAKIRPVLDKMVAKFKENYTPSQETSTDEFLLKFKGRIRFHHYNPQKRARFGIKVYKIVPKHRKCSRVYM